MQARGDRRRRRRILLQHRRQHRLVGDQGGVRHIEQMSGHGLGRRGEGIERIDALRDLGDATMAVQQHAGEPARIGEAAAHDARDLLGQTCAPWAPRAGWCRDGRAQVSCPAAPPRRRTRRRNRRRRRRPAGRARGRPADAPARRRPRRGCGNHRPRCRTPRRHHRRGSRRQDRPRPARRGSARRRPARQSAARAP